MTYSVCYYDCIIYDVQLCDPISSSNNMLPILVYEKKRSRISPILYQCIFTASI